MNLKDLHHNIKVSRAIEPRVIMAGNATYTSQIIDRGDFEALTFVVVCGALTDATYTCTLYDDTASNMATENAVATGKTLAANPLVIASDATGDNLSFKISYLGDLRYVRLKIVQTDATTGGYICATAIQSGAGHAPVA